MFTALIIAFNFRYCLTLHGAVLDPSRRMEEYSFSDGSEFKVYHLILTVQNPESAIRFHTGQIKKWE